MKRIYLMGSLAMALSLSLFSCTDENSDPSGEDFKPMESDGKYVGEVTGMPDTSHRTLQGTYRREPDQNAVASRNGYGERLADEVPRRRSLRPYLS